MPAAILVLMMLISSARIALGKPITISAAISLKDVMTDIGTAYEQSTGHSLDLNFGASGQLLAQIRTGAPVDVFIPAAEQQMNDAQAGGLIVPQTRRIVARNALVLIVPARSELKLGGFDDLDDPAVGRLAIGQPATVPAGEYAVEVFDHLHLSQKLSSRLIFAASVRQVLDYVERGEVTAGIVYRTDAVQSSQVRVIATADPSWHRPIIYPAAVIAASAHQDAAREFLDFLATAPARRLLQARGFAEPIGADSAGPAFPMPAAGSAGAGAAAAHPVPPILSGSIWPPLLLSLRVALVATAVGTLIAVPLAFLMARRRFAGRSLLEAALIVPLVLPPTVVGYLILIVAGAASPLGSALHRSIGYSILFNWHGAVVAAALVSLPLLYLPSKAAFASVDREMEDVARVMGANLLQTFWHVSLPIARRGIASGMLLAFARALGEFGATVMVLGDRPHRRTLPISIYNDYVSGDLAHAAPAVITLSAISLAVVLLYNRSWFSRS
jgi:molybdate ABC transporter permease protein/molybdenum ABC transporter molybdate-binding protein